MRGSRKFAWSSLLTAFVLMASVPGLASAQEVEGESEFLIIGLEEVPSDLEIGDVFMGGTVVKVNANLRYVKISTVMPAFAYAVWGWNDQVRYVEPVVMHHTMYVPDDPQWDDLYGMTQIRADEAWDVTLGEMGRNVCVLDTGIRATHEDLTGDRWLGGYDYVNNDNDPNDDHGHGTHVTGTAAATTDNGKGVAGVAQVGMMHVKVLNANGSGGSDDIADGMEWCADNEGHVISMSLGGGGAQVMEDGAQYAWDAGMLLVAAAGNDGQCTDCVGSPADYDTVMAITCTTSTEAQCNFSSEGPEAELAAPGNGIQSTCYNNDSSYCSKSGTSMSTPHVAGVAALVWSLAPNLDNQELRDLLRDTAKDLGPAGWDVEFGHGLVDAKAAVDNAPGGGPPGNLRPNAHAGFDHTWWDDDLSGSEAVTLDGSRSDDPDGFVAMYEWLDRDNNVIATGESPQLDLGLGEHRIRLKTTDNVGGEDYDTVIIKVQMRDGGPDVVDDFEGGLGAWTVTDSGGPASWSITDARATSPTHSVALRDYGANENDVLRRNNIDLRSADSATLTLQSWMDGEFSCTLGCFPNDVGRVQVSDDGGSSWTTLLDDYGDSEGVFEELSYSLDDYTGGFVDVRFTFVSNGNTHNEGWYIDDFEVETVGADPAPPVASTVPDVRVVDLDQDGSETATLSGNDAHDPDGTIVAYEWKDPQGNVIATTRDVDVTVGLGRHAYTLKVTDDDGLTAEDEVQVKVVDPEGGPDYHAGFETGDDGYTVQDDGGPTAWARTDARSSAGDWSMALRNYGGGESDKLVSPVYDLISADTVTLTVHSWMEGENNCMLGCFIKDYGRVQVSDNGGSTWSNLLTNYYDSDGVFEELEFNLDSYAGEEVQIRFFFVSDDQLHFEGWYIDAVSVVTNPESGAGGAPVAVAGPDQRVADLDGDGSEPVTLDGSGSTDDGGSIVAYEWLEGGNVIATGATATVSFAVGTHTVTLRVTDNDGLTAEDSLTVRVVGIAFADDFETGMDGWVVEGGTMPIGSPGNWALSTVRATSPSHSMAFTGYGQLEDDALLSPTIDLTGATTAKLRLQSWADGFNQCYIVGCQPSDYGRIEVSDDGGQTWRQLVNNYYTSSDAFQTLEYDLDEEAGGTIQLRFTWFSGAMGALGDGWFIDDVQVEAA